MASAVREEEAAAQAYLSQHRIPDLLGGLTSSVLYHRPERLREFLISLLERIKIARMTGVAYPYLMDNSNLTSMFEMMDPSKQGYITSVQLREALQTLGLPTEDESFPDGERITIERFISEVNKKRLATCSRF
ncbi:EF-hand calcium-binding domain-containing protein 10 isoform X2 [Ornithorhynchus anatinus]|uniref:EF-hand calcium-binding domain-containing protein 10 isoform X2 n=1 Tax=Ornithorhynchus anatinus TaxID=9258 RepID=UPI00022406D2|nr:EF-hand calcium-binding domain-containing protein 10 isoform X2 [Ornithorhynchus anatinus]